MNQNRKNTKTAILQTRMLLAALPGGIIPKTALMRIDVSDCTDTDDPETEKALRWSTISRASRKGLIVKRSADTLIHGRKRATIYYEITLKGLEYLNLNASSEYPWLTTITELYRSQYPMNIYGESKTKTHFYRSLMIKDAELMFREFASAEALTRYISNCVVPVVHQQKNESDSEGKRESLLLQEIIQRTAKQQHKPLNETIVNETAVDGIFIDSRTITAYTKATGGKVTFASTAIGVYLSHNTSFVCFHATHYGTTWSKEAAKAEILRDGKFAESIGYSNLSHGIGNALMIVDSHRQFAELFQNKWKRKRHYIGKTPSIGEPFPSLYIIQNNRDGVAQLGRLLTHGTGLSRTILAAVYYRHRGYLKWMEDIASLLPCSYQGTLLFIGSAMDAVAISKLYRMYDEGQRNFGIYCESCQKQWYKELMPELPILTSEDIPYSDNEEDRQKGTELIDGL